MRVKLSQIGGLVVNTCRIKRLVGSVEHARHHLEILNGAAQEILIIKARTKQAHIATITILIVIR
jgi:hypothetical protein